MAKRINVGAVFKGKDGKPDYIKISEDLVLKKGDFLNLESKQSKIEGITKAIENGKLSEEVGNKLLENVEKTKWVEKDRPDTFIRFEITKST